MLAPEKIMIIGSIFRFRLADSSRVVVADFSFCYITYNYVFTLRISACYKQSRISVTLMDPKWSDNFRLQPQILICILGLKLRHHFSSSHFFLKISNTNIHINKNNLITALAISTHTMSKAVIFNMRFMV